MSKDPAVLFYTSDFLTGTTLFNYTEKGQYIQLLCLQHQSGHLTKEDIESITTSERVKAKFVLADDGKYHNIRMHNESLKRKAYSESRSENRKNKNISKSHDNHMKNTSKTYDKHMEDENENEDILLNSNSENTKNINISKRKFKEPIVDELKDYIKEAQLNNTNAEAFLDFYQSKGWKVGSQPMKDWKAAARNWNRNQKKTINQNHDTRGFTDRKTPEHILNMVRNLSEKKGA